ncbi:MAG: hypothetical protein KKA76_08965, partial [Proteobacteria bacterium]|nr:hypothetical protein [Pseudomonadota bacterium]
DLIPGHILPVSLIKKHSQSSCSVTIQNRTLFTQNALDIFNGYLLPRVQDNQPVEASPTCKDRQKY